MTGTELAHAAAMPAPQGGALPTSLEWQALERMASTLADSDVIPYRLKRKPADVAVILLAAREYGIPPLMALSKLPVVNGTPAPMGELMVALILRAGHRINVVVLNADGSKHKGGDPITEGTYAQCTTLRREESKGDEDVLTFTMAEAVTAGLVSFRDGKPYARVTKTKNGQTVEEVTPWEQYPTNMLRWRAVANAARLRFPDVLLGMSYLPEELGATVDADGAPILEGEVIQHPPAPRRAPEGSLAQRTAQEAADRLATFDGPPDVLERVLEHARDNGYATAIVTTGIGTLPLEEAIAAAHADAVERVRMTVDATTADAAAEAPQAPASAPVDPPAPESPVEPAPAATPPPTTPPPTSPASPADLTEGELGIVEAMVYEALRMGTREQLVGAYAEGKAANYLDVIVDEYLPAAANRLELGTGVKLGTLILALGKRAAAGDGPLVFDGPPEDGWPTGDDGAPPPL